jgi:hypothetical protein
LIPLQGCVQQPTIAAAATSPIISFFIFYSFVAFSFYLKKDL